MPGDTNGSVDQFLRATLVPTISGVTGGPPTMNPGTMGSLQVTGGYLIGGLPPTLGEGVTVTDVQIADERHATIDFTVASNAVPGPRLLVFMNAGTGPGGVGGAAPMPGALFIAA